MELAWGEVREAELYAARLEDVAVRFGSLAWTAMAKQARGRVLAARGEPQKAFDTFEQARTAFDRIGIPYEAARCVMAQSRLFEAGKTKAPARASALAAEARRTLDTLGAADLES